MAKGYWIVGLKINNPEQYAAYRAVNGEAFRKFGGKFLARGGKFENPLGESWPVNSLIEFPSYKAATDCYHSPEYKRALEIRGDAIETDLVIVEGYDGAQP